MPTGARFARGLVVGKFAPLHLGHALLIERALAACEQVLVISYSVPEFDGCAPRQRAAWIAGLFPSVRALVIDQPELDRICRAKGLPSRTLPHNDAPAWEHRELVGWLCWSVLGCVVDAVFTSEGYGDGFAAHLSAYFGQRARCPPVTHVCVDRARLQVPISGTLARRDVHAARASMPALVYADFVDRVAILGGESSGKTTLAQALAAHFGTAWATEFGRDYWVERAGVLNFDDMLAIAQGQLEREQQAARRAQRWVFCDTTPLTTSLYSRQLFGQVAPALAALAQHRYTHVFLCAPDFGFVQDGTRTGAAFSSRQHADYLHELARLELPYRLLTGPLAERVRTVAAVIAAPASLPAAAPPAAPRRARYAG